MHQVVCEACEDGIWSMHSARPLRNNFQPRMMSLLALQRSNQSPACLKGPLGVISLLIVVSIAADSICNITLGLVWAYSKHAWSFLSSEEEKILHEPPWLCSSCGVLISEQTKCYALQEVWLHTDTWQREMESDRFTRTHPQADTSTQRHTHTHSSVCHFLISCCSVLKPLHPPCRE